eukprot:CAMPEP_0184496062 /NCGR_PEP_ID=MMETSP0113_2-20130426/33043_1 /TAXON_ID=91329 /ORGANISM="Norrisiella sphaerica, Strain BC52" /LENGTH=252 /DNA_ID=CAMNT_0026882549 /DNA_START=5 /DNA_END=763 /DNA_ORIENTATION=+
MLRNVCHGLSRMRSTTSRKVVMMKSRPFFGIGPPQMYRPDQCISGEDKPIKDAPTKDDLHYTLKTPLVPPFPPETEMILLGMGCFWCSENVFMGKKGIYSTHVGYAQGITRNPTYAELGTGRTNHNEVVRLVYYPDQIDIWEILAIFFESHDPTTPVRQGNDIGTQYRSGIYFYTQEQVDAAYTARRVYQEALDELPTTSYELGQGIVCTEILRAETFYYAELEHQQYLAKPGSRNYCGLVPLGVPYPRGKF